MDKICARCKLVKSTASFYRNAGWSDGLHPYCKPCLLAYQRERRLARLDITDPERRRWTRRFVRHDYFDEIDTPAKAYLLGLLSADGNVLQRQNRVTLELAAKDAELVELLRDEVAPGVPVRSRSRHGRTYAVFAVTSPELVSGLAKWNVVPRKTWSLRWPDRLSASFVRAYLLGYFDGDGFVTVSRSGKHRYGRWGLAGREVFLRDVAAILQRNLAVSARIHRQGRISVLHVNGRDALTVDEWLHADYAFGLDRKRLRARL